MMTPETMADLRAKSKLLERQVADLIQTRTAVANERDQWKKAHNQECEDHHATGRDLVRVAGQLEALTKLVKTLLATETQLAEYQAAKAAIVMVIGE
jgi:hypothetical protein